jgi:hypothetical protein
MRVVQGRITWRGSRAWEAGYDTVGHLDTCFSNLFFTHHRQRTVRRLRQLPHRNRRQRWEATSGHLLAPSSQIAHRRQPVGGDFPASSPAAFATFAAILRALLSFKRIEHRLPLALGMVMQGCVLADPLSANEVATSAALATWQSSPQSAALHPC